MSMPSTLSPSACPPSTAASTPLSITLFHRISGTMPKTRSSVEASALWSACRCPSAPTSSPGNPALTPQVQPALRPPTERCQACWMACVHEGWECTHTGLSFSDQAGLSTDHKCGHQYRVSAALMSWKLNELREANFMEKAEIQWLATATPGKKTKFLAEAISSTTGPPQLWEDPRPL